jgi:hypothetical protein
LATHFLQFDDQVNVARERVDGIYRAFSGEENVFVRPPLATESEVLIAARKFVFSQRRTSVRRELFAEK